MILNSNRYWTINNIPFNQDNNMCVRVCVIRNKACHSILTMNYYNGKNSEILFMHVWKLIFSLTNWSKKLHLNIKTYNVFVFVSLSPLFQTANFWEPKYAGVYLQQDHYFECKNNNLYGWTWNFFKNGYGSISLAVQP